MGAGQDHREDERVDEQQEERVDERPEEAEDRAAIAGLQLAGDQALDERAVAKELLKMGEQQEAFRPPRSYPRPRARRDLEADERLRQRDAGALEIDVHRARQALLGAPLRRLGARDVDVLGPLGDLRQHGHAIRQHLDEAAGDRQVVLLLPDAVPQLADLQRRQQRRVARAGRRSSPRSPAAATSSTSSRTSERSGVTISSVELRR